MTLKYLCITIVEMIQLIQTKLLLALAITVSVLSVNLRLHVLFPTPPFVTPQDQLFGRILRWSQAVIISQ